MNWFPYLMMILAVLVLAYTVRLIDWPSTLSRWKLVRTETRLTHKDVASGNVTSAEWRSNANATASAAQVLNSPDMKAILSIMRNETPMDMIDLAWGATAEDIARHHGYQKGYLMALLKIKSFGILEDNKQKEMAMTFENELAQIEKE